MVRLTLPPRQSSRDTVRWLHAQVITNEDLAERDLRDDLVEALAATPRVVVVEHAHRLSQEAAGQLQRLQGRADRRWSLILLGGPRTGSAISRDPLLLHAVCATVEVRPLRGDQLVHSLQNMHELFLGAGAPLLAEIDAKVCHGVLGRWARVLQHALHLRDQLVAAGREPPVLDRTFAKAVVASLPATLHRQADR